MSRAVNEEVVKVKVIDWILNGGPFNSEKM